MPSKFITLWLVATVLVVVITAQPDSDTNSVPEDTSISTAATSQDEQSVQKEEDRVAVIRKRGYLICAVKQEPDGVFTRGNESATDGSEFGTSCRLLIVLTIAI
jgi:hypothetical protein